MGFISFNLKYFKSNVIKLENEPVSRENLYRAKQLLKIIDDLTDEGYIDLFHAIEEKFSGIKRLRRYLSKNNEKPFEVKLIDLKKENCSYKNEKLELKGCLQGYLNFAINFTRNCENTNPFIDEIKKFSNWIGYEKDTAYIFLLRDTLLPYLYFKSRNRENLYPWLISRSMMKDFTKNENSDDNFRNILVESLEYQNVKNYYEFCEYCFPKIRKWLFKYPEFLYCIKALFNTVKEDKIVIIESGCFGTIPMILSSLDSRVTVKMFTSVPYLSDIYKNRIYTKEYEKNRYFETLYSQELFLNYRGFKDAKFYVQRCTNKKIEDRAIWEISQVVIR